MFFVETNVRKTISKLFEVVIRAWPQLGFVFSLYAVKLGTRLIRDEYLTVMDVSLLLVSFFNLKNYNVHFSLGQD